MILNLDTNFHNFLAIILIVQLMKLQRNLVKLLSLICVTDKSKTA